MSLNGDWTRKVDLLTLVQINFQVAAWKGNQQLYTSHCSPPFLGSLLYTTVYLLTGLPSFLDTLFVQMSVSIVYSGFIYNWRCAWYLSSSCFINSTSWRV